MTAPAAIPLKGEATGDAPPPIPPSSPLGVISAKQAGAETASHQPETAMTTSRTAELMSRLPRWFVEHARKTEELAQRRRAAQARRFELEFLCGIEVKDSGWQEWEDTVASFESVK